nr:TadE family type IV pilus minor pilin [Actinomadura oligospora]
MATAEIAVALPALVLVTVLALWAVAVASTHMSCVDAARAGARAAARGESLDAVRALVTRSAPKGATVAVRRDVDRVQVTVSTAVRPPALSGLPALNVQAHAEAETEPGAQPAPEGQAVFRSPGPLPSPRGSLRDRAWANAASLRDLPGHARLRHRRTGQVTRSRTWPEPLRDTP